MKTEWRETVQDIYDLMCLDGSPLALRVIALVKERHEEVEDHYKPETAEAAIRRAVLRELASSNDIDGERLTNVVMGALSGYQIRPTTTVADADVHRVHGGEAKHDQE